MRAPTSSSLTSVTADDETEATTVEPPAGEVLLDAEATADEVAGKSFCLIEAPDADAAHAVHREAHGLVADEIYPVTQG